MARRFSQLYLTDVHTAESLTLFDLRLGDLALGDRWFGKATPIVETRKTGAHLVVRITPQHLNLWTRQGEAFDLIAALRAERHQPQLSFALEVRDKKSGEAANARVRAHHLNEKQINRARRRVKRKASRN